MSTDPRLYRQFLLRAPHEGRAGVLAREFGISASSVYRLRSRAIREGALQALGECAYTPGPNYAVFVDHIDTAYGGFLNSHQLSERGLRPDTQTRAQGPPRLAPGWVNTGSQVTYVILLPLPAELASKMVHFGRVFRHQEPSDHGTAQFYAGKNAASVVLHLRDRPYPDGMEAQVPKFQEAEARAWIQEIVNAFPGLKVVNRPIWHPDPKAQESRTPLPSGELNKRILGVESVGRAKVGPATEVNDSPPGPSLETAGVEEARAVARAPFVVEDIKKDIESVKTAMGELASAFHDFADAFRAAFPATPKPPEGSGPAPPKDDGRGYG